jgi:hypothetical protein
MPPKSQRPLPSTPIIHIAARFYARRRKAIYERFFAKRETRRTRPRHALARQETRRGIPPGPSGAISVNTLFWKILVTRVNREMGSAMHVETQYLQEIATTPP